MTRYYGAVCRLCRRSGEKLMLKGQKCVSKCTFEKRPKPPGPQLGRPRRLSDRGVQLREKQKIRYIYGMMERQFKRFFTEAEKLPGATGDSLIVMLERRLDNIVYRLGFGDSRSQTRQLVLHGHIMVNGSTVDIPSYMVKEADVVSFKPESAATAYVKNLKEAIASKAVSSWLSLDREKLEGKVVAIPTPNDIPDRRNAQAVVEYYSR